jgi:Tol biopolymer transport system component
LLLRDLASGQEKELLRGPPYSISNIAPSPDGRRVAFRWWDQTTQTTALRIMPIEGGEPRQLFRAKPPEHILNFAGTVWTPDGQNLLYVKSRQAHLEGGQREDAELWLVSSETGKERKLGSAMEQLRGLRLAPDGQRLAFSSGAFSAEVWVMENFLPQARAAK